MNYNIAAYAIYSTLMIFIILYVGRYFYTHGRVYIISLLHGNVHQADHINNILLVAYCLFNIGYAFLKLQTWQQLLNAEQLISSLAVNMGVLILILAGTHYLNMLAIYLLSKSDYLTHKSFQS